MGKRGKKPGSPKTGGRQAGTPNKTTSRMRELLTGFMHDKWPVVQSSFDKLQPKEKVLAFTRLLPFITPQYSAVNFSLSKMTESDLETIIEQLKLNESTEENATF